MSTEQPPRPVTQQQFQQTKDRIRSLVQEIAGLSKQDLEADVYYAQVIQRVVAALAALGGAVWVAGEGGRAKLAYQINVPEKLLDRDSDEGVRHYGLLDQSLRGGQPQLVPPLSGDGSEKGPGNPTRCLLLLAPMRADDHVEGVIEIFQRPGTQVDAQRGYLQFLLQICEMVGEWLKSRRLKHFSNRQDLWNQADEFASLVHESLDLQQTAFTIANEGRRMISCDRVSVAVGDGDYAYIEAVSGQDTPDDRSNVITMLKKLAATVMATGEPLWYEGSTEDLPPQIEDALHEYVDESHTKAIAILPLHRPADTSVAPEERLKQEKPEGEVIGALIVEQIEDLRPQDEVQPRVDLVRRHAALALAAALDHSNLFLMPLWKFLGDMMWVFRAGTLPKTIGITALVIAVIVALFAVPYDLWMEGKGSMQPYTQRQVFSDQDGIITEVLVKHGDFVKYRQKLAQLRNTDLDVKITDTNGQIATSQERILSINRILLDDKLPPADRAKLDGERAEVKERLAGLQRQLKLLMEKKDQLTILSPIDGIIASWKPEETLLNRPVQRGQLLLSIAKTGTPAEESLVSRTAGKIKKLNVGSDQLVNKGEVLLELSNPEVEKMVEQLAGELKQLDAEIAAEQKRLETPEGKVAETRTAIQEKLVALQATRVQKASDRAEEAEKLKFRSPAMGRIVALGKDLEEGAAIQEKQTLFTFLTAEYEVEVFMPENKVGHIRDAQAGLQKNDLEACFIAATEPGTYYYGEVAEVDTAAQLYEEHGHSVKIRLNLINLPESRRPGATVTAKVNCGPHSVGYVILHPVWEWFQTYVLF